MKQNKIAHDGTSFPVCIKSTASVHTECRNKPTKAKTPTPDYTSYTFGRHPSLENTTTTSYNTNNNDDDNNNNVDDDDDNNTISCS